MVVNLEMRSLEYIILLIPRIHWKGFGYLLICELEIFWLCVCCNFISWITSNKLSVTLLQDIAKSGRNGRRIALFWYKWSLQNPNIFFCNTFCCLMYLCCCMWFLILWICCKSLIGEMSKGLTTFANCVLHVHISLLIQCLQIWEELSYWI